MTTTWSCWAAAKRLPRNVTSRSPNGAGGNTMPKRTRAYRESLLEDLQDSAEASEYLNAAMQDSDEMLLVALRDVAEARQMTRVAEGAGVAREALYRMLRKTGNPTFSSLMGVLAALGLTIQFAPASPKNALIKVPRRRKAG